MRLPADRANWTPRHAEQAVAERDRAFELCEECDAKYGRMDPKTLDAWQRFFRAEDVASDVCRVTNTRNLGLIFAVDTQGTGKGALSDKSKGIIVGAASALSLAGLLYAIAQQDKPKPHAKKPHELHEHVDEAAPTEDMFAEPVVVVQATEETETETTPGGVQITTVLKDVSVVGEAARGLAALEPIAEALIMLI